MFPDYPVSALHTHMQPKSAAATDRCVLQPVWTLLREKEKKKTKDGKGKKDGGDSPDPSANEEVRLTPSA